jgi:transposase
MLEYAVPPGYQRQQPIKRPKLGPWVGVIDAILEDDKQRPAKQRHTAKRIFERLKEERDFTGGYTIVCFRQACVVEDTWFISWGLCRDDERVRASG